jgi:ribosomal protein L20A (L18A)
MGRVWQVYVKEVAADDETGARERVLSVLGSQHRTPRKYIEIAEVREVPEAEIEDHAVRFQVAGH